MPAAPFGTKGHLTRLGVVLCGLLFVYLAFAYLYNPFQNAQAWRPEVDSAAHSGFLELPPPSLDEGSRGGTLLPPPAELPSATAVHLHPPYPYYQHLTATSKVHVAAASQAHATSGFPKNPCSELPGADDVLVVMKTGASEVHTKLPVHFNTTFACAPHYAIFSDMSETVQGFQVEDVLSQIPEHVKHGKFEFEFYDRLHQMALEGKTDFSPLYAGIRTKEENPAWVLDRWKFLPSMERALERKPDAKWYYFMEADSALVWWNLLAWLSELNPEDPHYLGGQAYINEVEFAHGGAGFVLSHAALRRIVDALQTDPKRYERVQQECCGDLVAAIALRDLIGLRLTPSWPSMQGETPTTLDYSQRHWCYPAVSYHHMNDTQSLELWDLAQDWQIKYSLVGPSKAPLRHRDVFEHFVWPSIQTERINWDNLSADLELGETSDNENESHGRAPGSAEACLAACADKVECIQWSWKPGGQCKLQFAPRLGDATKENKPPEQAMRSGWMSARIDSMRDDLKECGIAWIT